MSTLDVCPEDSLQSIKSSINSLVTSVQDISSSKMAYSYNSNSTTYTIVSSTKTCTSSSDTYLGTFTPEYSGTYTISATIKSSSSSYTVSVVSNSMVLQVGGHNSNNDRGLMPSIGNPSVYRTLVVSRKSTSASAVTATVLLKAHIPYVFYLKVSGGTGTLTNLKFTTTLVNTSKSELFADIGYSHDITLPVASSNTTVSANSNAEIYSFYAPVTGVVVLYIPGRPDGWATNGGYIQISVGGVVRSVAIASWYSSGSSYYYILAIVPIVRGQLVSVRHYNVYQSITWNFTSAAPHIYYDLTTLDENSYLYDAYIEYTGT